jgi:hypothetical protein
MLAATPAARGGAPLQALLAPASALAPHLSEMQRPYPFPPLGPPSGRVITDSATHDDATGALRVLALLVGLRRRGGRAFFFRP